MVRVVFESWREGIEKVSLAKLQVEKLGLSLKESKTNVDSLLNEKEIVFEIVDTNSAKDFQEAADKLGVNCKII